MQNNKIDNLEKRISDNKIAHYFAQICLFVIFYIFFLIIALLLAFNLLPPGLFLQIPLLALLVVIPGIFAHIVSLLLMKNREKSKSVKPITKRAKIISWLVFSIVIVVLGALLVVQNISDNNDLKAAKKRFVVTTIGNVSIEAQGATLIELERQYEKLSNRFDLAEKTQNVTIELYPNIEILQQFNKLPYSFDAFITYVNGDPIIKLPVEVVGDTLRKSNQYASTRPSHELTHFFIHEPFGLEYRSHIPLWFDEGMAQYESFKGMNHWVDIPLLKIGLWIYNIANPDILNDPNFILYNPKYPASNLDLFYLASFQFTDYLASRWDVYSIYQKIVDGNPFVSAFQEITGKDIETVYNEWKAYYFRLK
jgi:hypothetical protein